MSTYLIIDLIVLGLPLSLAWIVNRSPRILDLKAFAGSLMSIGLFFIIWDLLFTNIGVWDFSEQYTLGIELWGLPLEEILFFAAIPFSSLALYELIAAFIKDKKLEFDRRSLLVISMILLPLSLYYLIDQTIYTGTVLLLITILFFWYYRCNKEGIISRNIIIFLLISLIPFYLVNSILTGLPVVTYNEAFNIGIRIGTIPLEDFFYSFLMLTMYLLVYLEKSKKHSS